MRLSSLLYNEISYNEYTEREITQKEGRKMSKILLHIINARTLLGILYEYIDEDSDIFFAIETAYNEVAKAEEAAKESEP